VHQAMPIADIPQMTFTNRETALRRSLRKSNSNTGHSNSNLSFVGCSHLKIQQTNLSFGMHRLMLRGYSKCGLVFAP
jgi:hypothetical protein